MNSKEVRFPMIGRCKRLAVGEDKLDRLTDLPINIQHQIQGHLSIEEAARMSVLSRPWRHVWASIPKLKFPPMFCKNKQPEILISIVNTVLSQHIGAIKIFLMNISSIPSSQHSVIDQWILLLSRNGVLDLTLQNIGNAPYKLPSYVYSVELVSLRLFKCIFSPPCSFRGFHKLKRLQLHNVAFELDAAMWMPKLLFLQVSSCSGLHHFNIYAPEIRRIHFHITKSAKALKLNQFMECQKLKTVILASDTVKDKVMNMTYLLNCWPELFHLSLDSYYLKSFASGTSTDRLAISLNSLRSLSLFEFDFDDEDQIFSLLRMLGSFPNLSDLLFMPSGVRKGGMDVNENHFEGSTYWTQGLNKLQTLKMYDLHGSRTELLFIRFILASAPLLLKAFLFLDVERVNESQCLKISKEVTGFPWASPKLEITCEPLKLPLYEFY